MLYICRYIRIYYDWFNYIYIDCPIEGQVYTTCGSCDLTCDDYNLGACPAVCRVGCACPSDQVIDVVANRCVPKEECPPRSKILFSQLHSVADHWWS